MIASGLRGWLALLAALALPTGALAKPASGEFSDFVADGPTPLSAIHAKTLTDIGDDVIRFSDAPFKGSAIVIEIHRSDSKSAKGEVYFLRGSWYIGWQTTGRIKWFMSSADYDKLASAVDAALVKGEPGHAPPLENGDICIRRGDGPHNLGERRRNGQNYDPPHESIEKSCYDPDDEIAQLMGQALATYLNRFTRPLGVELMPKGDQSQGH